jgi:hypothetical protein
VQKEGELCQRSRWLFRPLCITFKHTCCGHRGGRLTALQLAWSKSYQPSELHSTDTAARDTWVPASMDACSSPCSALHRPLDMYNDASTAERLVVVANRLPVTCSKDASGMWQLQVGGRASGVGEGAKS